MRSDDSASVNRRGFLRAATGAAAGSAAVGEVAGQEGTESGGGSTEEVVVGPGGELVFDPAETTIQPGTTVEFVWDSPGHNIVVESQPEDANWEGTEGGASDLYGPDYTHTHTFEVEGTYEYVCAPHEQAGMVASIEVTTDTGGDGGGGPPEIPDSAKTMGIASTIGMLSTLGLAYVFLRFGGDTEG